MMGANALNELPSFSPSPRERGEGARRAGEGMLVRSSLLLFALRD